MRGTAGNAVFMLGLASATLACGGGVNGGGPDASGVDDGGGSPGGDGGGGVDGAVDADRCVDIDASAYDRSCEASTDCTAILTGEVCTGRCDCGGTPVNQSGAARYAQAISGITLSGCPCLDPGMPACVQGTCALCGLPGASSPPGCPDGG